MNLRRRVSSYFQRDVPSSKTRLLVRQIRGIEYVVVGSEAEALILENSLIKEHQPRYNILLKDDKTYPEVAHHGYGSVCHTDVGVRAEAH